MKNKIVTRALSLLLALVCVMGILPLSAFAAEGLSSAPGSITQKSSDYMKIGGRSVRYQAASSVINNVGLPYVFDEQTFLRRRAMWLRPGWVMTGLAFIPIRLPAPKQANLPVPEMNQGM